MNCPVSSHLDLVAQGMRPWTSERSYLNMADRQHTAERSFTPATVSATAAKRAPWRPTQAPEVEAAIRVARWAGHAYCFAMAVGEAAVHREIAQGLSEHPAKKGMRFNILVTAVEIGGSIGLFHLAQRMGASDVVSYLIGSIAPVVGGFMVWARARKFSGASAAIFAFTALSAVIALIASTTPKVLLYKDCAVTALIGLIFLSSCVLVRKPLVFYMAQRYGTDGTHDGMAIFDAMWDVSRDFRTCVYVISYLWAVVFVIQAAGTALIIRETRYSTAYNYDQILPMAAIGLGIAASLAIGRYFNKKGEAPGGVGNAVPAMID